ncbi:hypothetical protein BD410DRAFT_143033 [Rickenella mellea]|uniref:Mitochondrial splicing suppressor 51-like C-terminal domain-containing protein n=1 Tax=Rickenella mellea TaxID=50990 RepID=A0A4Y7Q9Y9_9AGAM|nr:hypothetical protein BD410DRAFT_143033 [Rickenella mellea]
MFKRAMEEAPAMNAILRQFPWGRMKLKGLFQFQMFLASRNLLGDAPSFAYWQDTCKPYYGGRLLEEKYLCAEEGWKLPLDEIPNLTFHHRKPPARCPPSSQMQDWKSYHEWRGLPMTSPAALILQLPLTIYRLLHLLGMTPDAHADKRRRSMAVYYLCAANEVDYLSIFGELALLLPDTDIEMVVMCESLPAIFAKAKPSSLVSKPYCYQYQAPAECGGSTIRIRLVEDRSNPRWLQPSIFTHELNVFIGLNISRGTNIVRTDPFINGCAQIAQKLSIPMGVTAFHRLLLENNDILKPGASSGTQTEEASPSSRVALNPFGAPGSNPPASYRVPWTLNGFTAVVQPYVNEHRSS